MEGFRDFETKDKVLSHFHPIPNSYPHKILHFSHT